MTPTEIKELRRVAGMTQTELAQFLRVSVSAVRQWESGDRNPSGPVIKLLAGLATVHKH